MSLLRQFAPISTPWIAALIGTAAVSFAALNQKLPNPSEQKFPDVIGLEVESFAPPSGVFEFYKFTVTVSSPYTTAQRYANGFRVTSESGVVLAEANLAQDRTSQQRFHGVVERVPAPRGVRVVVVQARDRIFGYGGKTLEVPLPGR